MHIHGYLTLLGTGGSMGVPVIGCTCSVCQSPLPQNKRTRPSALLSYGKHQILIDCGPDFKQQAMSNHIGHLDGVIFTHAHNDHTAGVDDLKIYCLHSGKPLPCLLSPPTAAELRQRFYYIFEANPYEGLTVRFDIQLLEKERNQIIFQN